MFTPAGPNLLLNPSFSVSAAEDPFNRRVWFGDYIQEYWSWVPDPQSKDDPPQENWQHWARSFGDQGQITTRTWQTVPLPSEPTVVGFVG